MTAVESAAEATRLALAERLRRRAVPAESAIPRRPDGAAAPLSFAQERVWFMEQFAPGTAAYGSPLLVRLGADADLDALHAALRQVCARHESLRMRFPTTEDGRPTVVVEERVAVDLPVRDAPDDSTAEAQMEESARRPFDLAAGPLLRTTVWRVGGGAEHILLIGLHHIVTDGWSNDIILDELMRLYAAIRAGRPLASAEPVRYGDFAAWQREVMSAPGARKHVAYWLERLTGVPTLELPTDFPRPPTQRFDGASHHFRLDAPLVAELTGLARAHRATLFMGMLAGLQVVLSRYSGQTDFAIGSPVAGRSRPDLDNVVGMFVNMLPLRVNLNGNPTMGEVVSQTRQVVLDALAHQDVPFEQVINELGLVRDVSRSPLFQTMFVLQNYSAAAPDAGHDLPWRPVELPATRFDLELHAYPVEDGGLQCRLVYNTALFQAATVARLANAFQTALTDLVARPQVSMGELELLDQAERSMLREWNATAATPRWTGTLPALFEAQVRRTPGAIAVADATTELSYDQLDRFANQIAHRLRAGGAGPETVVAIAAQRSVRLVAGLLGILKAGAAYLPLDPEYPAERLTFMLADSGSPLLLAEEAAAAQLVGAPVATLRLDDDAPWAGQPEHAVGVDGPEDGAAYLIYTSGSTGRPKGVINAHRGVVNRLDWMQSAFGLGADDVVLQKTPAGFDVSVWEFFWPLITGARLVMAAPGGHRDPAYLREAIDEHGLTTVHFVPSMLTAFLADIADHEDHDDREAAAARCRSLRRIICSGEELPVEVARRCTEVLPWVGLHNLYGPTEAAIDVTAWPCSPLDLAGRSRVPIGAPISNTRVHILAADRREVPIGAIGELHIGGVQVARGYHRRPALTAERFVPDPFGPPGARLYATGDLARWRPDGQVEFLGRADGQVKLRGLRIELGEIEVVLRERPEIRDVAVAAPEVRPGDKRIVAYLVMDSDPDVTDLRAALRDRLPDYMVPTAFVRVPELPLSANGKLDRARLPLPEVATASTEASAAPRTETERALAEIWCAVLGLERVGIDDDFFALGGHSLLLTQVAARLRGLTECTGRRIGVMDLFQNPTIRALATRLSGETDAGPRRLLYELTPHLDAPERTFVCVPYGGGSAVVYQAIAAALPSGNALLSVAIPGHDVGLDEEPLAFDVLARRCADEVLERVRGPLVLYGHCGVGGALIVEMARLIEAAGREIEAVYVGGVFPFARPNGLLTRVHTWLEDLAGNRNYTNWLKSMGVDMDELDSAQANRIISNMRNDGKSAEAHFTALLATRPAKLRAPIISVVGERDPITDYYQERYREWQFLTDTVAVVVLDEAGHFFLRYRAQDVVDIITSTHLNLPEEMAPPPKSPQRWWLGGVARASQATEGAARVAEPTMRRFGAVSVGQLVSLTGTMLTAWAIPVWLYLTTGSLLTIGISGVSVVVPILLATPIAGAVADRYDRRTVMLVAGSVALAVELTFALLLVRGSPPVVTVYAMVLLLSFAGTFQRISFSAAIPQLVPKRFLGHANGIAQLINGAALLFVPLIAAALLAAIGLRGILFIDVASYAFALGVLALVRFPNRMGRKRKETFGQEVLGGLRIYWGNPGFRASIMVHGFGNLLYAAPVLLAPPLVLAFGSTADVGRVAFAEGIGALVGGLIVSVWGGPRRRRMVGNLLVIAASGVFVAATGLSANLTIVMIGVFGTGLFLAIANGIYVTVIQVKMPQRYHGRVLALNQTLTWSTLPLGFLVLVPASGLLEPLMAPGGALAGSLGQVVGTGPGRGLGLAFLLFGVLMTVNALLGLTIRRLRRLDLEVSDSLPDDLLGAQVLAARGAMPVKEAA